MDAGHVDNVVAQIKHGSASCNRHGYGCGVQDLIWYQFGTRVYVHHMPSCRYEQLVHSVSTHEPSGSAPAILDRYHHPGCH